MKTLLPLLLLSACAPERPTLDVRWQSEGVQLSVHGAESGRTYEVGFVGEGELGLVSEDCRHDPVCHYVEDGSVVLRYGADTVLDGSESELSWLLWERETGRCWVSGAETRRWAGLGCE